MKIHIFPETHESVSHLREQIGSIYLHLIDQEANTVKGFMLKEEEGGNQGIASVNEAWSVKFPSDQSVSKIGRFCVSLQYILILIFQLAVIIIFIP